MDLYPSKFTHIMIARTIVIFVFIPLMTQLSKKLAARGFISIIQHHIKSKDRLFVSGSGKFCSPAMLTGVFVNLDVEIYFV